MYVYTCRQTNVHAFKQIQFLYLLRSSPIDDISGVSTAGISTGRQLRQWVPPSSHIGELFYSYRHGISVGCQLPQWIPLSSHVSELFYSYRHGISVGCQLPQWIPLSSHVSELFYSYRHGISVGCQLPQWIPLSSHVSELFYSYRHGISVGCQLPQWIPLSSHVSELFYSSCMGFLQAVNSLNANGSLFPHTLVVFFGVFYSYTYRRSYRLRTMITKSSLSLEVSYQFQGTCANIKVTGELET